MTLIIAIAVESYIDNISYRIGPGWAETTATSPTAGSREAAPNKINKTRKYNN